MTPFVAKFQAHMDRLPLVAILRGLKSEEALAVGQAIVNAGFHILEVPLNSPEPFRSIQILSAAFPNALVGAGTVTTAQQVRDIKAAGGQLIISPHLDDNVVCEAVNLGMVSLPGVATPSEAFRALALGANGLKLFPAEMISPAVVKSMRAVLPKEVKLCLSAVLAFTTWQSTAKVAPRDLALVRPCLPLANRLKRWANLQRPLLKLGIRAKICTLEFHALDTCLQQVFLNHSQ